MGMKKNLLTKLSEKHFHLSLLVSSVPVPMRADPHTVKNSKTVLKRALHINWTDKT